MWLVYISPFMKPNIPHCQRHKASRRCAKASCIEAITWCEVGDKLQSCRPKWFMALAESDKFCPLCSTNHCSLSRRRSWRSSSWCQGSCWPQTHPCRRLLHALRRALFQRAFTDCQKYRNHNTVQVFSAAISLVREQKRIPSSVPCVFFLWLAGNWKMHTTA